MKGMLLALCTAILVSACASHTGVISMGMDTYMIAKQRATGFPGLGNMKGELLAEASSYCSAQGKYVQLVSTEETKPPYVLGNYPRTEIHFMCLQPGDKDLQRPNPPSAPDNIIELRVK